jgi:signal transduction histidine kinase
MRSPRTDPPERSGPGWRINLAHGVAAFVQRLNTRLVIAIATVSVVALLVSAVAINQILPGYFAEQTQQRVVTAAISTGLLLRQEIEREAESETGVVAVQELRDRFITQPVAERAQLLIPATIEILNARGQLAARSAPVDVAELRGQGLRRDPAVEAVSVPIEIRLSGGTLEYSIRISDPYTSREATLAQLRSSLVGAGLLALVSSLVLGLLAARRVTAPIDRLRRVAGRVAQGHLDERATASGVLEVDELAAQFNVMADRLAGTLRMLEADRDRLREFVADVSHELRTPISALKMYAELLSDGKVDEPTRAEFLQRSSEQIARLEWLSTNLLDLSRIDAGIFPLDMRTGDLRDPTQAVVQAMSEVAVARGIALDSQVPARPVELRFDRERIVQLLTNLVGNALKFTPSGGSVSVRLDDGPDAVTVEVRDSGPGIPADELPRIFERFYRGTNTGEARASGSGLGLAIVRSIVEMHGGEIDVASVLGEGTTFRISLPRHPRRAAEPAPDKVNETSRGGHPARNAETVP